MSRPERISETYNPYDFGNPVTDRSLFSGRDRELSDINYYLDQAVRAPRPINLALLGPRAAGKTSLLNMVEIAARERGMCTARINLNEGDTASEMLFFYKIFDAVFTSVCDFSLSQQAPELPFGGKRGKTYQTYLDMISAYDIPEDRTWCPFIFPIQYAKAMGRSVKDSKVSDQNLLNDLTTISAEVGRPCVLLFDECNVLANKPILLEMVRNIFMNIGGYMLVFTGTQDLFPVMDEVFSPIIRQFKKVDVGAFEKTSETRQCISKPLESIGIFDLEGVIDLRTLNELNQIHNLTGGRPYEIQLLCHFMFRRIQLGRRKKMELDLEVLDDVLDELKKGHDIALRPIINKVKELSKRDAAALRLLLSCNGKATLDQLWFLEYVLRGTTKWTKEDLVDALERFQIAAIVNVENGVLRFVGDDFDRIYIKYYARQRRIKLSFADQTPEDSFNRRLTKRCYKLGHLSSFSELFVLNIVHGFGLEEIGLWNTTGMEIRNIFQIIEELSLSSPKEIAKTEQKIVEQIYWLAFENTLLETHGRSILNIHVMFPWGQQNYPYYSSAHESPEQRSKLLQHVQELDDRAKELGGSITFTSRPFDLTLQRVAETLKNNPNIELVKTILDNHFSGLVVSYLATPKRLETAKFHGQMMAFLGLDKVASVSPTNINNYGYLQLALGNYGEARLAFDMAISAGGASASLPYYNRASLKLMFGEYDAGVDDLQRCLEICERDLLPEYQSGVTLFVPTNNDSHVLQFSEKSNLNLLSTVSEVLKLIRTSHNSKSL